VPLPVIVVRDAEGSIKCLANRSLIAAALIALDDGGNVEEQNFKLHLPRWRYDRGGNCAPRLSAGINGVRAGMPKDSSRETFPPEEAAYHDCAAWCSPTLIPEDAPTSHTLAKNPGRIKRVMNRPTDQG